MSDSLRAKTEFKAIRELVGMTQATLAKKLDVEVRTIKRWEGLGTAQVPPIEAWTAILEALDDQRNVIRQSVADADAEQEVALPYWTSETEYLASSDTGDDGEPSWSMANANARAVASALWATKGIKVRWVAGNRLSDDGSEVR